VVKLKYRGPNTGQPAASVTCKPMKSLRQQPEIARKDGWSIVSGSGWNLGQVAVYTDSRTEIRLLLSTVRTSQEKSACKIDARTLRAL
jgi:hypothetical protein